MYLYDMYFDLQVNINLILIVTMSTGPLAPKIRQRLEFIEFCIYWENKFIRSDLARFSHISEPQAAREVAKYNELFPGNIERDTHKRCYIASQTFKPMLLVPNASRYLSWLQGENSLATSAEPRKIARPDDLDRLPILDRNIDADVLRTILSAIRDQRSLEIEYRSLSGADKEAKTRRITPHALANSGLRWHARAYCHKHKDFRDFVISRCTWAGNFDAPGQDGLKDDDWHQAIDLILVPNPRLDDPQRITVAHDYSMQNGRRIVQVRRALCRYFIQRYRLDVADSIPNPLNAQIALENRAQVKRQLKANYL